MTVITTLQYSTCNHYWSLDTGHEKYWRVWNFPDITILDYHFILFCPSFCLSDQMSQVWKVTLFCVQLPKWQWVSTKHRYRAARRVKTFILFMNHVFWKVFCCDQGPKNAFNQRMCKRYVCSLYKWLLHFLSLFPQLSGFHETWELSSVEICCPPTFTATTMCTFCPRRQSSIGNRCSLREAAGPCLPFLGEDLSVVTISWD